MSKHDPLIFQMFQVQGYHWLKVHVGYRLLGSPNSELRSFYQGAASIVISPNLPLKILLQMSFAEFGIGNGDGEPNGVLGEPACERSGG